MKATTKSVNAALKAAGYDAEIANGGGYWYFFGPDADHFFQQGIYTQRISDLTVEQWVEEFADKARQYADRKS